MEESVDRNLDIATTPHGGKLSLLPLMFLIFYEVSGGPFGIEDTVKAADTLLAILGFIAFPFIWSIPEALITAELSTAFPDDGGYVVWVEAAFGPFWGFQEGWWKWLSGVIDNALYPVLFLDYLKWAIPQVSEGPVRFVVLLGLTLLLTLLNYRGLTVVGYTAVVLGVLSLLPFCMLIFLSIPHLKPNRWTRVDLGNVDWKLYLNTLFWNLNYWDSVSTVAGEIEKPSKTLPKAIMSAVVLVVLSYLLPLVAAIGAMNVARDAWEDGYLADIGMVIGGPFLKWWIEGAAALSNAGQFEAEMSSDSFQLLGMAERGMLPQAFANRSKYGTPTLGIIFSATGVILLSWLNFQEIIEIENYLYCFGMFLEFGAFIWLRIKHPNLHRPYKVPVSNLGAVLVCLAPGALLIVVMCVASVKTIALSILFSLVGFLIYPVLELSKRRKWFLYVETPEALEDQAESSEEISRLVSS